MVTQFGSGYFSYTRPSLFALWLWGTIVGLTLALIDASVTDVPMKWALVVALANGVSFFFRDLCCQGVDALGPRSWAAAGAACAIAVSVFGVIMVLAQYLPLAWVWLPYAVVDVAWFAMPSFMLVTQRRPRMPRDAQEDWS